MEKLVDARDAKELSGAVPIKQRKAKLGESYAYAVPSPPPPAPGTNPGHFP